MRRLVNAGTRLLASVSRLVQTRISMAFVKVAKLADLPPGQVMEATVDGRYFAVCNTGSEITCLDGECACTGGPLSQGTLRDGLVICPWHGWRYDCKTGVCAYDADMRQAMFPVKVEDGEIWIDASQPLEVVR